MRAEHRPPELIDSFLNGPRTLSNERLSYLVVSHQTDEGLLTPPQTPELTEDPQTQVHEPQHELLICAMHFLGDGMALHNFANEFFGLLGSDRSDSDLRALLDEEWRTRWGEGVVNDVSAFPELRQTSILSPDHALPTLSVMHFIAHSIM